MENTDNVYDKEISTESDNSLDDEYIVEEIISSYWDAANQKRYYLLKWRGFPSTQNTYEPEENLNCPALLKAYKERKKRENFNYICDSDSDDEDLFIDDTQSQSSDSSSNCKKHPHGTKSDKVRNKKKRKNFFKRMEKDKKSPKLSSYQSSSKIKSENKLIYGQVSSSVTTSSDSSTATSLQYVSSEVKQPIEKQPNFL